LRGIIAYGTYLPYHRLDRAEIGKTLGSGGGRGTRAVASYDEDTTSMAVEAGRSLLRAAPSAADAGSLYFATAEPAYLDKNNASAVHAGLGLNASVFAVDMIGAVRSGAGALKAALDAREPAIAVLSDMRIGLPGSTDESGGGDGAAAFLCGEGDNVIAEFIGIASTTQEFLDRYRLPGDLASKVWEERFGEFVYVPLARAALTAAYQAAEVKAEDIAHFVVAGLHARAARTVASGTGHRAEAITEDLTAVMGNTGAAQGGLMLADVLSRAEPNQLISVLVLSDGATVMLFRTTDAVRRFKPHGTVKEQIASGKAGLTYPNYLTWRGMLNREPPRRPDPDRPAAPPSFRSEEWKFGFMASRCDNCGRRHLPPMRVCIGCHSVDKMSLERIADEQATVATFTIDRLAFSPSPPVVAGVIDFDGGGRFQCEFTDVDPDKVAIGDRVEMTFRRLYTAEGVHNYFWKARPIRRA
jgi:3-hydroxy-3-methylglutaryl CoA synthase